MNHQEVPSLISTVSATLTSNLNADTAVVGLTRDPLGEPDHIVVYPPAATTNGVTLSASLLRRTLDEGRSVLFSDAAGNNSLRHAPSIVSRGIRSALCVPISLNQTVTGFIYVESCEKVCRYDERDLDFASAVGAILGTVLETARLQQAELDRQRMAAELAGARRIQQAIMPSRWPVVSGWEIAGTHSTSREIGGDYYDAIVTGDGRLWLVIADVSGKGVAAALQASAVHAAVQAVVEQCRCPSELLLRLNQLLLRREIPSSFVTCLAARIDPQSGEALLASAGHPYPVFVSEEHTTQCLDIETGFVLGAFREAGYQDVAWSIPPSGVLLLYTDGVPEAMSEIGEEFGMDRLLATVKGGQSARDVLADVRGAVDSFRGDQDQSDDITILTCKRARSPGR
jgi:serine phosphatase RsbU (regulator of sigma subunit)